MALDEISPEDKEGLRNISSILGVFVKLRRTSCSKVTSGGDGKRYVYTFVGWHPVNDLEKKRSHYVYFWIEHPGYPLPTDNVFPLSLFRGFHTIGASPSDKLPGICQNSLDPPSSIKLSENWFLERMIGGTDGTPDPPELRAIWEEAVCYLVESFLCPSSCDRTAIWEQFFP